MERPRHYSESPAMYGPVSVLEAYIADVSQVPLLTFEEEVSLSKRIESGRLAENRIVRANGNLSSNKRDSLQMVVADGCAAKEHFIRANLRLPISIATLYQDRGVALPDLIQSGNEGLLRAVEKFDYRKGYRFVTYAYYWILNKIQREVSSHGRTIRIPPSTRKVMYKLKEQQNVLSRKLGRNPSPEELAHAVGKKPKRIRLLIRTSQPIVSLDLPVGERQTATIADFVPVNERETPHVLGETKMLAQNLNILLATLDPRAEKILRLRFGLDDGINYTLEEVGTKLEITRERVRQIEAKALLKMRATAQLMGLSEFLYQ